MSPSFQYRQLLRFVVGFVLGIAGFLKAIASSQDFALAGMQLVLATAEICAGFICLFGMITPIVRFSFLVFFGIAFIRNSILAIVGADDCGCFGAVAVPPLFSLALNAACIIACSFMPVTKTDSKQQLMTTIGLLSSAAVVVFTIWFDAGKRHTGSRLTRSFTCDLSPNERFPLENDIVGVEGIMYGKWQFLFFRSDCASCMEEINKMAASPQLGVKAALIEIPPFGLNELPKHNAAYGYLNPGIDWEIQTPMMIELENGLVVGKSCGQDFGR